MRAPEFWSEGGVLPTLLAPAAAGYDLAGRLRRRLVRPAAVPVPVLCVGNLVAGGAGKTPVALSLVEALAARGLAAHCLSRGYGGRLRGPVRVDPARHDAAEVGDEPLLLARAAPTWVARDRGAAARAAVAAGAAALILDDGFQNPAIAKDLSLLVVDGTYGFGNSRVIPAGPLRESVADGLARADAVVVLGPDVRGIAAALERDSGPLTRALRAHPLPPGERVSSPSPSTGEGRDGGDATSPLNDRRLPVLHAELQPAPGGPALAGRRVVAFAGIGRPEKFFATLRALGAEVCETRAFADHHPFTAAEVEALLASAAAQDALAVTTEKDAVRLPPAVRARLGVLPVRIAWREPALLHGLLDRVLGA